MTRAYRHPCWGICPPPFREAPLRAARLLRDAMGTQIMSAGLNVIDEPHRRRGLRSAAFDGEGLSPETLNLVQDGVLQSWLLDSTTARQLELESNARAARGVGGPPSPSATNLYLAAGTQDVAGILGDVGEGFFDRTYRHGR
ncbi:MAG: hypothetical protein CM15mP55_0730 [Hyphomicrobiales bacterium]|nr:MAG: hypothetical protein CM15mP55_0730 [Hyphomicrobiales bacterium]